MVRVPEHCCFLFVIDILYVVYRHFFTCGQWFADQREPTVTSAGRLDMARDINSVPNLMPGGERPASPSARERRYKRILVEAASQGVDDASVEEFDRVLAAVARQVPDATLGEIAFALVWAEREADPQIFPSRTWRRGEDGSVEQRG